MYDTGTIGNEETPLVQNLSDVAKTITKAGMPGAYMVEIIPLLDYFPAWIARWKRTASAWHKEKTAMFNKFNDDVKARQVCVIHRLIFLIHPPHHLLVIREAKRVFRWRIA